MVERSMRRAASSSWRSSAAGSRHRRNGSRRCEQGRDWLAEKLFEQPRGGWSKGTDGFAADESLEVPQAQRPGFVIVPGEGFGVLHELLEGHALLADALFEHRPGRPVGQPAHLLRTASSWRPDGGLVSFR